ncbi:hypothetical protein [Pontibacter kalidii]|uniref:hypothetical protein n=1 Tax=Pontibacter kalidii TaxID=2592049 RepID=UPI0022547037|nr:hypothetical protein [Pontibacter kalidii]
MVIFNTPGVNITFQEQEKLLLIHWLKKPNMELLMEAYLRALQFVCENRQTYYFCTDQTLIGPLDREQEAWLNQEYYPEVYACIQDEIYAAVVFSNAHFKAIVTNYQVPATLPQRHFIQFNYFTKQQEALQWLSDVKKGQDVAIISPTN